VPGDIGAVAKVEEIEFDCVLHDSHDEDHIHLKPLQFPQPMQGLAVQTRRKGDEQRLFEICTSWNWKTPASRSSAIPAPMRR
jgi:elongation factor G